MIGWNENARARVFRRAGGRNQARSFGLTDKKSPTQRVPVKSVTHREFFRTPDLLNELKPGEVLRVTRAGQVSFLAVKPGRPRRLTTPELVRQAAAGRPFDGTAFVRQQRT